MSDNALAQVIEEVEAFDPTVIWTVCKRPDGRGYRARLHPQQTVVEWSDARIRIVKRSLARGKAGTPAEALRSALTKLKALRPEPDNPPHWLKDVYTGSCTHPEECCRIGPTCNLPAYPLLYGSALPEECSFCLSWRLRDWHMGVRDKHWRVGPYLTAWTQAKDEDDGR